jgi:hypothetical protein
MSEAIEAVDPGVFERVWKLITEIGTQERHFNSIQNGYRTMASAWLLATFGGFGFAATQDIHIGIHREVLVAAIAFAGSVGIILLWILDLLVYHRLLQSCFVEGLILEQRYPWLPPIRNNMMATQKGQGVLFRVVGFYVVPVVVLLLVAAGTLSLWYARAERYGAALILAVGGFVLAVVAGLLIWRQTSDMAALEKRLAEGNR